ncbi:hypothetical protein BU59_35700 [Escherichia coli O69:H11 str. 07-3763]|nr:hypothetical protein BU59_35700 [Escherichia coli O69:H11 str. 07-3763]
MRFSTIVSVVTLVWGISPRQPSGKNIIRWLLKKRTNGSVRYCQYTSYLARVHQALLKNLETELFDGNTNGFFMVSGLEKDWDAEKRWNVATWLFSNRAAALEASACICGLFLTDHKYNLDVYSYIYAEHGPLWIDW